MLKNKHLITKTIFQVALYLLEVLGISLGLTKLTNMFWPVENFIDFIERATIFYTFYQIIIYGILQQLNDIKKDEYLAILTMYKYLQIYSSDKRQSLKEKIIKISDAELDNATFNDNSIRSEYLEIRDTVLNKKKIDETLVECKIVHYEHCCEEVMLNWKFSILIRMFK